MGYGNIRQIGQSEPVWTEWSSDTRVCLRRSFPPWSGVAGPIFQGATSRCAINHLAFGLWRAVRRSVFVYLRSALHSTRLTTSIAAPNQISAAATLHKNGLLGPDVLLSHNNNPTTQDTQLVTDTKAKISSTPGTELQMGHGNPVCLRDDLYPVSSLGIDCHSVCSAYMPAQMMLALQWARARRHEDLESQNKWSSDVGFAASAVFNLGTILGARAIGMQDAIGSIAVGKRADLVIFDCNTPGMVVAADRDPVAAIVLHSTVRDVNTVIIDGVVRKRDGILQPVHAFGDISASVDHGQKLEWEDIVPRVLELGRRIDEQKRAMVDGKSARKVIMGAFHMNFESHVGDI